MLRIESRNLPDVDLTYVALRLSFFETLERITLAEQLGVQADGAYGYLAEVPFLRNVAPQVQLDVLLDCWRKLRSHETFAASIVDEAVLYAACESAARIVEADEEFVQEFLGSGPRAMSTRWNGTLADELRFLHLSLPNDCDFLLISQFQDAPPEESHRLKERFGLDVARCDELFEVLGRWYLSTGFARNGMGLLEPQEADLARSILGCKTATDAPPSNRPLSK